MGDERFVDEQLVAVLNEVLDAIYQAKQASWSASTSPARPALQELVAFLIEQSGRFMVAEERVDGRSPDVSSPSSHQRGNLLREAHNDVAAAVALLGERLERLIADARTRARRIADAPEATLLEELADGLDTRLHDLRAS